MTITDRRAVILGPDGLVINNPSLQPQYVTGDDIDVMAASGSFRNVMQSQDRGYVWIPTLDTKKETDAWSRTEAMKRSRYICNNGGGLPQRLVFGIARMICGSGLIPQPLPIKVTGQEERRKSWIRRVRNKYMRRAGQAKVYDLSRRRSAFDMQQDMAAYRIRDGDAFVVLARDATGRLRRRLYEGHQIGNGSFPAETLDGWYDGVKLDEHNGALAYRVLGWDKSGVKEIRADVPSQNVCHFADYNGASAVRGITRFVTILGQVLDRGEIMNVITKGVKMTAHIAHVIETAAQQARTPGAPGTTAPGGKVGRMFERADGKKITLEEFLSGAEARELAPGQTFKVVQGQNPHPNTHAHLDEIVRSIAFATGYSPEIVWKIIELGGANSRFALADTQQQLEQEQGDLVDAYCGPDYIAWLWDEIEATRDLRDDDEDKIQEISGWERHGWITPGRLTVDFGRDGKVHIERYKRAMITMASMYGMQGQDWEEQVDQYLDERQAIVNGVYSRKITDASGTERSMLFEEAFPEQRQQTMGADPAPRQGADSSGDNMEEISARFDGLDARLADVLAYAREPKS
jgi:capsid protein